uniref:Glycine cleavage system protein H n=1 Tax=candidate division WOR-3 bacterium TaxID=2052148 RepID=A0A7V0Z763_UNCW3
MKCPFLEEMIVQYCSACQIKKMIPKNSLVDTQPCEGNYSDCPVFKDFFAKTGREQKQKEEKMMEAKKEIAGEAKPCIWMKAGVIAYRMCTSDYDCKNCSFDQALLDASGSYVESPIVVEAIKKLKQLPASERKCRYMLTGDFSYKICSNNYECWHCSVDQYIQDLIESSPYLKKRRERLSKEKKVRGFAFREDYYYTPNHIWLKVEGELLKIGIDDFATRVLGRIEKISFSNERFIIKDENAWQLGSGNRIVQIKSPITGEIVEINNEVQKDPSLIQREPYHNGWLLKIKMPKEIKAEMMKGDNARDWLEREFDKLHQEFAKEMGILIADGGELIVDIYERLSDEQWHNLIKKFLL